jgi:hypothetical protein
VSDYKNKFLDDIHKTLDAAIGTTIKSGFMSGNKPLPDLSSYADSLKARLLLNETSSPELTK